MQHDITKKKRLDNPLIKMLEILKYLYFLIIKIQITILIKPLDITIITAEKE